MKKTLLYILTIATIFLTVPCGSAEALDERDDIIYLESGAYIEVSRGVLSVTASGTTTRYVDYNCFSSDGTALWNIRLSGTFTYNGTTATCTSSSCTVDIYDTSWYEISRSATKSGASAYASVEMGRKVLGITVERETYELSLTCDKDGNVS